MAIAPGAAGLVFQEQHEYVPVLRAGAHQQCDRMRRAGELHRRRPGQRRPAFDQGTVQRQLQEALQLGTDELADVLSINSTRLQQRNSQ